MNYILRLLYFFAAATLVSLGLAKTGAAETAAGSGAVKMLTTGDFDGFIKENPISLVKFMAPWCGHCKKLAPEYEAAAVELKKDGVPLAEVDATQEHDLAKKYGVQGFPTMYLFRDGNPEPYSGGRTKASIIEWVQKMTGPAVEYVDAKTLEQKTKDVPVVFLATVTSETAEAAKLYEKVASSHRMKGKFLALEDTGASEATLKCTRMNEEPVQVPIPTNEEKLVAWIETESFPLFGPVNGENYAQYAARSKNWVWFAGNEEEYTKHGNLIRKVSKNYRTEFNFIWLNTDELKNHAEAALGLKEFPSIAIVYEEGKYHMTGDITEKYLTKFIENVKANKVKRFLKSEPVPEKNDEPVKVVVGSTFSDMVLQKDKDVFLEIYAPWCGHCKKLAPIWDELAEKTKNSKHFLVAKFDGTSNEPDVSGFEFHGFPTLYFVPAGKSTPMPYDGERNLDELLAFAKKNAVHPLIVAEDEEDGKDEL